MSRFVSALLAVLLLTGPARAAEPWLAVTEDWPPYNYADATGRLQGFSTEVLQRLLNKANVSMPIKLFPWVRAYRTAQTRPNTVIYTMARLPEREKQFTWLGPIAPRESFLFRLGNRNDIQAKTLQEAAKYVTGVVRADVSERELLSLGWVEGKNLDISNDDSSLFRKLKVGLIDLLPSSELAAQYRARQMKFDHALVKVLSVSKQGGGYYIAVSNNSDPAVVARLQKAMKELQQSGELNAIYKSYLGS